ncbi:DNA gyrase/topoisomerase IV subunit A, partial [Flavobacteriaceae bacterium]|nr:DNA gyrase/topoisomerase IV subunit A [Flavobacteriaceae bacterium]
SISPLGCVIVDHKPHFIGVSDMLRISTDSTVHTLKKELEVKLNELENQWHFASLERIFIENKVYRLIEDQETWEGVLTAIDEGLKPFVKVLKRPVVEDDLVRLTEIKIKRISKFDIDKAQQRIDALEGEIKEVRNNLDNLIEYAIDYFTHLKKEYGKDKDRLSEIRVFDDVDATKVVVRNLKLYVNKEEGFIGTSLKKDEYVCDCADIDDIIVFTKSGIMQVVKVDSKVFIEKDIIYAAVFKKKDQRTIYNLVYKDGKGGTSYIKRFAVTGVTRDKPYNLTQGKPGSEILYFSANPNGEAETITVLLRNTGTVKKLKWELDFADLQIKGRGVKGNIVSKYNILRVELKEKGVSTLKPRKIWFDPTVQKLNVDERGNLLGAFRGDDKLLLVDEKGVAKTVVPDLSLHFDIIPLIMERWVQERPITAVYFDSEKDRYFIKRFLIENKNKEDNFIGDNAKLIFVSSEWRPVIELVFVKPRGGDPLPNKSINVEDFISVKGFKAIGNQLTTTKIKEVILSDSLPYEEPKEEPLENLEVIDANQINDSDSNDTQTKLEL